MALISCTMHVFTNWQRLGRILAWSFVCMFLPTSLVDASNQILFFGSICFDYENATSPFFDANDRTNVAVSLFCILIFICMPIFADCRCVALVSIHITSSSFRLGPILLFCVYHMLKNNTAAIVKGIVQTICTYSRLRIHLREDFF